MKGTAIVQFLGGCLVLVILSTAGGATDLSKGHHTIPVFSPRPVQVLKPRPAPVVTKTPVPKKNRPLPDLVVERVSLRSGMLVFTLKNRGRGAIPDREFSHGMVKIDFRSGHQVLSFGRRNGRNPAVDPGGRLKKPGGKVTCSTALKPAAKGGNRSVVVVTVDSGHRIREQNEQNNTGKTTIRLIPTVKTVAAVPVPGGNQTMARSVPGVRKSQATRRTRKTFFLIEKVFLRTNSIHIRIRNASNHILENSVLPATRLRVTAGRKHKIWPLVKIDRKRQLVKAGGRLDFDTGLVLEKKTHVTARLETGKDVKIARVLLKPVIVPRFPVTRKKDIKDLHLTGKSPLTSKPARPGKAVRTTDGDRSVSPVLARKILPTGMEKALQTAIPGKRPAPPPDGGDIGTPPEAVAILGITQLSLTPEEPAKNTPAELNVTIRNSGPVEMPYLCNCSVVAMTSDRFGTRGSWGEPVVLVSPNAPNVSLIAPGSEETTHIPIQFTEAGYHVIAAQLHVDAGHLCRTEEDGQRVMVDPSAQIRTFIASVRGDTPQIDLVLSEVRRNQGRLYLTMYSQGERGAVLSDEDYDNSTITVGIEQGPMGNSPSAVFVSARLRDIDPHGLLRIPWAFGSPPALKLNVVWPTRDMDPSHGLSPVDLVGNKVRVELNANHSIAEIEYENNVRERIFPPGSAGEPDLVVCMPKYIFLSPPVTFNFPIVVKNIGTAKNSPDGVVTLKVGGHGSIRRNVPVLQPGEKQTIAVEGYTWWNNGVNHFTLRVDSLNRIEETVAGEQNNVLRGLIERNAYYPSGYTTFNAAHPDFCSDDPDAATPVP